MKRGKERRKNCLSWNVNWFVKHDGICDFPLIGIKDTILMSAIVVNGDKMQKKNKNLRLSIQYLKELTEVSGLAVNNRILCYMNTHPGTSEHMSKTSFMAIQ